jgi:hypothetical protein
VDRRRAWIAAAIVLVLLLGGFVVARLLPRGSCARVSPPGGFQVRSAPPPGQPAVPTTSTTPGLVSRIERAFRSETGDAVFCGDFADPAVIRVGSSVYTYATTTRGANIPVLRGGLDPRRAQYGDDALPRVASWAVAGTAWAPGVMQRGNGFVLYYAVSVRGLGRHCISVATSRTPTGPFVDRSTAPLVCPTQLGGAIDPEPFVDADGRAYLLWKNDGNCCELPVSLWSQLLTPDGLGVAAPPTRLLDADQPWEAGVIENPAMVLDGGRHYLFFSGNAWNSASYAIGYATCASVAGPCTARQGPWVTSVDGIAGPGGQSFFTDRDGRLVMVFHAWLDGRVGYPRGVRNLFATEVRFVDGAPVIE